MMGAPGRAYDELELPLGFTAPVLDAQRCFRVLLEAMARPGCVVTVPLELYPPAPLGPAAAAVLLTLADAETPVFSDAGPRAAAWLRFHAGCPLTRDPTAATLLLATGEAPSLPTLDAGTDEAPQRSATLILQCAALDPGGPGWRLSGPGIESVHRLRVTGAPPDFLAQWADNHARFPRGVDVLLCAGDRLAALPRSVSIEHG